MKAKRFRLFRMPEILRAMKVEGIEQCIVEASLPRSDMFPILPALAIEMDHVLASVWLNQRFSKFPFAESYHEATRLKHGNPFKTRLKHGVFMSENAVNILNSGVTKGRKIYD